MDEKKFAVLLTDTQDVKIVECDPQEEMFDIARGIIGCDWIELVEPEPLTKDGYLLLIDEEGKLRDEDLPINCIVHAADERLELLSADEATRLAGSLEEKRDLAVEKISRAFGLLPVQKPERDIKDLTRRQPCRKNSRER